MDDETPMIELIPKLEYDYKNKRNVCLFRKILGLGVGDPPS